MTQAQKTGYGCLGSIALFPVSIFLRAWALCTLWLWFLVPMGLSPLSYETAAGISCIVSFLCPISSLRQSEEKPSWGKAYLQMLLQPLIAVMAGAFVRWLL